MCARLVSARCNCCCTSTCMPCMSAVS
jgi:hypothetical protein